MLVIMVRMQIGKSQLALQPMQHGCAAWEESACFAANATWLCSMGRVSLLCSQCNMAVQHGKSQLALQPMQHGCAAWLRSMLVD